MQQAGKPGGPAVERKSKLGWQWGVVITLVAVGAIHALQGQFGSSGQPANEPSEALAPTAIALVENELQAWNEEERPGRTTYQFGKLQLTFSSAQGAKAPLIEISGEGFPSARFVGEEGFGHAAAEFGVGTVDPAAKGPQIIFTSYSGGAHCCVSIRLIELAGGTWRSIDVDTQDGDSLGEFPLDVDGDGVREFALWDNRFLYAFASHAESYAPPRFVNVRNGEVKDVSAGPGFKAKFAEYVTTTQQECEQAHNNGACAAFVAAAARVGRLDWAWPIMLAGYNRSSDWTLPTACRDANSASNCPEATTLTFGSYPEALQWFLGDAGYTGSVYVPPIGGEGPSFACSTDQSEALQLICATPELAKADRELAVLYDRAMALSTSRTELRESERQFITLRDAAPADVFALLRLYQARLEVLRAISPG